MIAVKVGGGYNGAILETAGLRRYVGGGWCLRCSILYFDVEAVEFSSFDLMFHANNCYSVFMILQQLERIAPDSALVRNCSCCVIPGYSEVISNINSAGSL